MSEQEGGTNVEHNVTQTNGVFSIDIDEGGLSGLSALLSVAPSDPLINEVNRRKLQDRRVADRRIIAQQFDVSE